MALMTYCHNDSSRWIQVILNLLPKKESKAMVFKELVRLNKGDRLPTNPQAKLKPRRIRRAELKNIQSKKIRK